MLMTIPPPALPDGTPDDLDTGAKGMKKPKSGNRHPGNNAVSAKTKFWIPILVPVWIETMKQIVEILKYLP